MYTAGMHSSGQNNSTMVKIYKIYLKYLKKKIIKNGILNIAWYKWHIHNAKCLIIAYFSYQK